MILFLVRRYNDIDHTGPIVYRMAKDGFSKMAVLALNPGYDIDNDFRLRFLRDNLDVYVDFVYRWFTPGVIKKTTAWLMCYKGKEKSWKHESSGYFLGKNAPISKIFSRFQKKVRTLAYRRVFEQAWAEKALAENNVKLLVLDWQKPGRFITSALVMAAKKLKIPILTVPHGISLYSNVFWTNEMAEKGARSRTFKERDKHYDAVAVQFDHYRQRLVNEGVDPNKVHVLGSARFCEEWEAIYFDILPKTHRYYTKTENRKIKVVFMDHNPIYRINVNAVVDTFRRLKELKFVEVVVKPSTGGNERKAGGYCSPEMKDLAILDYQTSSVELIDWADVVMGTTSSIIVEALLMNTVFIYPKYFHKNTMLWEEYGACWTVNNYDELKAALSKVADSPGYRPYTDESVNSFIEEVVYGGQQDRDVLGNYKKLILDMAGMAG